MKGLGYLIGATAIIGSIMPTSTVLANSKTGRITSIYYSSATNYAFRVQLDNAMTDCVYQFAYINANFDNYQAYVAGLLSAYYTGRPVYLYYNVDSSGYCGIYDFSTS